MLFFYVQYLGFLTIGLWGALFTQWWGLPTALAVSMAFAILWFMLTEWANDGPDVEESTLGTQ